MSEIYAQDGVHVAEGDSFSQFAGELCRSTYGSSPFVDVRDFSRGHFRGPRGFQLKNLPEGCFLDLAPDGDGTKPVLIDAMGTYTPAFYDSAAYGWIAMTCGDITRWGGLPLVLVNNFDVASLGETGSETNDAARQMLRGAARIAREQNLVLFKGETAELGLYVGTDNRFSTISYLWSGVALGVYHPDKMITGDSVEKGMVVMALREQGFRNNGISSVRAALRNRYGEQYYTNTEASLDLEEAAAPAVLYDRFLAYVNGWYRSDFAAEIPMHLIVHVTGGALRSKLAEDILFPRGLSAILDDLWDPPVIMSQCAEWRGMADEDCYEVWNGGQGALVVIDECHVETFCRRARAHLIEAKVAGRIRKEEVPTLRIYSKFGGGREICYRAQV